jgi:hypothetical protein
MQCLEGLSGLWDFCCSIPLFYQCIVIRLLQKILFTHSVGKAGSREQGKTEKLGTRNLMPRRGIIIIAAVTPAD